MNTIKICKVCKKIDENDILSDVCLELEGGKIYGFVGKNGSGKTMLFRVIAGLVKVSSGKILYNQKEMQFGRENPLRVGIMIENAGLYPNLTAYENLKLLSSIRSNLTEKEIRKLVGAVGLNPQDKRRIKKYSLGMRQRLTFAQAIMEKPEVLLLDEPTNALDTDGVKTVRNLILQEKERGAVICIASHNEEDIATLCDEVFEVKCGQVRKKR